MNYLETQYPSPRFPQLPSADGSRFGRTDFILAYTLANGDYPVLEANIEHAGDAGAALDTEQAALVAALQSKIEIIGVVGRGCFAPRLSISMRDGRRFTKEYNGRELMWDFAKDAGVLRRFIPGLPDRTGAVRPPRGDHRQPRYGAIDRRSTSLDVFGGVAAGRSDPAAPDDAAPGRRAGRPAMDAALDRSISARRPTLILRPEVGAPDGMVGAIADPARLKSPAPPARA